MLNRPNIRLNSLISICAAMLSVSAMADQTLQHPDQVRGLGVAFPWSFEGGDKTSRETARRATTEILDKAGYAGVPEDVARSSWRSAGLQDLKGHDMPSEQVLEAYGKKVSAAVIVFGRVAWKTRSIWVDLGPKTISTAHVDAYVFDVASGHIVYKKEGVEGRSDETENGWKVAADVLVTPLVTAVSGGPKTPREQRAVEIALGKALHDWVRGTK